MKVRGGELASNGVIEARSGDWQPARLQRTKRVMTREEVRTMTSTLNCQSGPRRLLAGHRRWTGIAGLRRGRIQIARALPFGIRAEQRILGPTWGSRPGRRLAPLTTDESRGNHSNEEQNSQSQHGRHPPGNSADNWGIPSVYRIVVVPNHPTLWPGSEVNVYRWCGFLMRILPFLTALLG